MERNEHDGYGLQPAAYEAPRKQPQQQPHETSMPYLPPLPDRPLTEGEAQARIAALTPDAHHECRAECIRAQLRDARSSEERATIMIGYGICSASTADGGKTVIVTFKDHHQPLEVLDALKQGFCT